MNGKIFGLINFIIVLLFAVPAFAQEQKPLLKPEERYFLTGNFNTVKSIIEEYAYRNGGLYPSDIFTLYKYSSPARQENIEQLKNPTVGKADLNWLFAFMDYKDYISYKKNNSLGVGGFVIYQPLEFSKEFNGHLRYKIFATDFNGEIISNDSGLNYSRIEYNTQLGFLKSDLVIKSMKELNALVKNYGREANGTYSASFGRVFELLNNKKVWKSIYNPYTSQGGFNKSFIDMDTYKRAGNKAKFGGFIIYEAADCRSDTYRYRRKTYTRFLGCFDYRLYGTDYTGNIIRVNNKVLSYSRGN